jgi:hypothetical protein
MKSAKMKQAKWLVVLSSSLAVSFALQLWFWLQEQHAPLWAYSMLLFLCSGYIIFDVLHYVEWRRNR